MTKKNFKIIKYPNPILMKISKEIDQTIILSEKFQDFCVTLVQTMEKNKGIGLAAPQVGRNIRVIAVQTSTGPLIMANPRIAKKSWKKEREEEGCLSVPNVFAKVERHKKINCLFFDQQGCAAQIEASGLFARVIQHEIDHLDGILFIDKARNFDKSKLEPKPDEIL